MLGIRSDSALKGARIMVFADCENIVLRTGLDERAKKLGWLSDDKFFSWNPTLNRILSQWGRLVRIWGYTAVQGGLLELENTREAMRSAGISAPQVFKKEKGRQRKQVDIALATEATKQAHLDNFDVAVFVTGDGDFAPVFRCLKDMGKGVVLFSPPSGLSPLLERDCDEHYSLTPLLTDCFHEVEVLASGSPLDGQTFTAAPSGQDFACVIPLLIRRSKDSAPGRRSVALSSRSGSGVKSVRAWSSSFSEECGRRSAFAEDESSFGSELLDLLPELEYSGINLTVTLFKAAADHEAIRVTFYVHSETTTDHYTFLVAAAQISGRS